MANEIPQSHAKLATTAARGVGGEHSPYARRSLSAGYKGLIQGAIGGATLYGTFGAAIGTIVSVGLFFALGMNPAAFWAIPIIAGLGAYKGADTFGNISAYASVAAETSEINERRTALNERLHETTSQKEADEIIRLLHEDTKAKIPEHAFHWKTAIIGAVLGAVIIGGIVGLLGVFPHIGIHILADTAIAGMLEGTALAGSLAASAALGAAVGGLAGATIGIDREYIRGHFDKVDKILSDPENTKSAAIERQREAAKLSELARGDSQDMQIQLAPSKPQQGQFSKGGDSETHQPPRVKVDKTTVQQERLMSAEEAIRIPL